MYSLYGRRRQFHYCGSRAAPSTIKAVLTKHDMNSENTDNEVPDPAIVSPTVLPPDAPSSDDDAPEEISHDTAATTAKDLLRGERIFRAGIAKRRRDRRRARAAAQTAANQRRAAKNDDSRVLTAEVLERAAAALDAQEMSGKSLLESKTITRFVDARSNSRTVGKYKVVAARGTDTNREKKGAGRVAIRFLTKAFNAKERVPARQAAQQRAKRNAQLGVRSGF